MHDLIKCAFFKEYKYQTVVIKVLLKYNLDFGYTRIRQKKGKICGNWLFVDSTFFRSSINNFYTLISLLKLQKLHTPWMQCNELTTVQAMFFTLKRVLYIEGSPKNSFLHWNLFWKFGPSSGSDSMVLSTSPGVVLMVAAQNILPYIHKVTN